VCNGTGGAPLIVAFELHATHASGSLTRRENVSLQNVQHLGSLGEHQVIRETPLDNATNSSQHATAEAQ
jgi:hypothetical protein